MKRLFQTFYLSLVLSSCLWMGGLEAANQGIWTPLTNQPTFQSFGYPDLPPDLANPLSEGAAQAYLLTDGRLLVQNTGFTFFTSEVWTFTPDINGSYINGTWTQVASLPDNYAPLAGVGGVLADGRVIVIGGEYNGTNEVFALTNVGYIYDPQADTWTRIPPPPFFRNFYPPRRVFAPNDIGDASCIVLADGTFMLQSKMSGQAALLDLASLTWTETGTSTKFGWNDEEGLTLLPDGTVLTVNCYAAQAFMPNLYPPAIDLTRSEIYDPATGNWSYAGSTIVSLTDFVNAEVGPAILRPDGKVVCFGGSGTGQNSIYNFCNKTWTPGPTFPYVDGQLSGADTAAVLLPNGNIFTYACPYFDNPPVNFFELTYDTLEFVAQPDIPNAANDFFCYLLLLPTGQVFSTDQTNDVEIYTPSNNNYKSSWAPVIKNAPKEITAGSTYKIDGTLFNGWSQANSVGDDSQNATNYPLVRVTNDQTGHVFYCRTHDHSSMAVASNKPVYTYFDVPAGIETGKSKLEVVANGIPSKPFSIIVN